MKKSRNLDQNKTLIKSRIKSKQNVNKTFQTFTFKNERVFATSQ